MLIAVLICLRISQRQAYSASYGVACTALEYQDAAEAGKLTLTLQDIGGRDVQKRTFKVEDPSLRNLLSGSDLNRVIGAQLFLDVPYDTLYKNHLDTKTVTPEYFMQTDAYDDYFRVVNVFWND